MLQPISKPFIRMVDNSLCCYLPLFAIILAIVVFASFNVNYANAAMYKPNCTYA